MTDAARWLCLALLIAPLAALPPSMGFGMMQSKNAVFTFLGLAAGLALVRSWWLRGFLVWAVVSVAASGSRGWGVSALLGIAAWTIVYEIASRLTEAEWRIARWVVVATALAQPLWMLVQWATLDPIFAPVRSQAGIMPDRVPVTGLFSNPMDTSLFLGLALPIVVAASWWALIPIALAIGKLGATVGVVGVLVTLIWLGRPVLRVLHTRELVPLPLRWPMRLALAMLAVVVLTGGLAAYVWAADPQGMGVRPMLWGQLVEAIRQHPIVGWGPNALDYRMLILTPATMLRWPFGFNEYLQGAAEVGLPGLALALGFLGALARRLRGRAELAGELVPFFVTLLLVAGFSIPLRVGPAALLVAVGLGRLQGRLAS